MLSAAEGLNYLRHYSSANNHTNHTNYGVVENMTLLHYECSIEEVLLHNSPELQKRILRSFWIILHNFFFITDGEIKGWFS